MTATPQGWNLTRGPRGVELQQCPVVQSQRGPGASVLDGNAVKRQLLLLSRDEADTLEVQPQLRPLSACAGCPRRRDGTRHQRPGCGCAAWSDAPQAPMRMTNPPSAKA
ncbi:hypothetical protein TraAM80_07142 [Trypanosoma rangeli]|uniref:Uncharacterized protein n=1 Tax=Trypanosoma rangeli TaxID=5698 RepID=A0A422N721_TRYRA|nr:uncharacterized protein TraAM80_07142 [Trypanosoma rangeli]RNF01241.1 hypothetical protein TraAM80_07142 [Trypanosoma rangeli]|eukprot:RNF01241.1 hypothetical protein TraAM80_07142 [Trypanosoma rangeli]